MWSRDLYRSRAMKFQASFRGRVKECLFMKFCAYCITIMLARRPPLGRIGQHKCI